MRYLEENTGLSIGLQGGFDYYIGEQLTLNSKFREKLHAKISRSKGDNI
jgi:hypothetical protein